MKTLLCVLLVSLVALPALAVDEKKLVDMTYPFNEATQHWPTAHGFKLEKHTEGMTDGHWYAAYDYSSAEHVGTHMDAPFHFAQGKWKVEQVPLSKTIGPGIVVDVSGKAKASADYRLQITDLQTWEKRHGRIAPGTIVLLYTGWGKFWKDRKQYFGVAGLIAGEILLAVLPAGGNSGRTASNISAAISPATPKISASRVIRRKPPSSS